MLVDLQSVEGAVPLDLDAQGAQSAPQLFLHVGLGDEQCLRGLSPQGGEAHRGQGPVADVHGHAQRCEGAFGQVAQGVQAGQDLHAARVQDVGP